jgi:DNA-directed RNA polymerase specialized sigma24 family protein
VESGTQPDGEGRRSYLTDVILDDAPAPKAALAAETEARLEAALWRLGSVYREVICLRAYCGMSDQRIAAAMELPSAETAAELFLSARAELRNRL